MDGTRNPRRSRPTRRTRVGLRLFVSLLAAIGVGAVAAPLVSSAQGSEGATATWDVDVSDLPTADSTAFTALVVRLGCNNGDTGVVLDPAIAVEPDRVVVTFEVEPLPPGAYTCPGNRPVPYTVDLGGPIGERELVDGACLAGEATTTASCVDGATRWSAAAGPTTPTAPPIDPTPPTSVPAPPPPPCPPDGSAPPDGNFCVVAEAPPSPAPDAGPARPVEAEPNFTG